MQIRRVMSLLALVASVSAVRVEAATFRHEVVVGDGDIGYAASLMVLPPATLLGVEHRHVLAGVTEANPFFPTTVSGKAVEDFTADLSEATAFEFAIRAPEGQHFQIDLPAGVTGAFTFEFHFAAPGGGSITLMDDAYASVLVDGLPLNDVSFGANGVSPNGKGILLEALQTASYSGPLSFAEIVFRLDYAAGIQPIDTSGALPQTLSVTGGYLLFSSGVEGGTDVSQPRFIHVVPEPAGLAVAAAVVPLVLARRRQG